MTKFKFPTGQSSKKDISSEWPKKIVGDWKINEEASKIKRYPCRVCR